MQLVETGHEVLPVLGVDRPLAGTAKRSGLVDPGVVQTGDAVVAVAIPCPPVHIVDNGARRTTEILQASLERFASKTIQINNPLIQILNFWYKT